MILAVNIRLVRHIYSTGVLLNEPSSLPFQVENNETVLEQLPLTDVSSPVILGYSPNCKAKYLHRGVTFLSAALCAWQIWRSYK